MNGSINRFVLRQCSPDVALEETHAHFSVHRMEIDQPYEPDRHHFSVWAGAVYGFVQIDRVGVRLTEMGGRTNLARPGRAKFNHHCDWTAKALIYQIFLIFQIFAKLVQHLAALGLRGIACKDEMNKNAVDHRLVLDEATFDLLQQLILVLILGLCAENAFDPAPR